MPLPFSWLLRRCVSWSFIGLCLVFVCRSGPLLLQLLLLFAATAALPLVAWSAALAALPLVGVVMASSGDDMTVVTSSSIFIGTTDDEGWAKYGVTESDSTKGVSRKKEVKVEEKAEDSQKKDPEKQEKEKEDELVNKMTTMDLKPVVDPTSSKSLPVDPSSSEVSAGCADAGDSKESLPSHGVDSKESLPSHVPAATEESTPLESMEPDFGEEPKKMSVDALEATSSAEAELAQPLPRSRIDPLPGGKSAFALLDGPLPEKEVLVDSKPSKELAQFVRQKSLLLPTPDGDSDSAAVQPLPRNMSRDRTPLRSCLARSASRPRSKTRGRDATRSRSRASPERRIEDGRVKPSGFVPGHVTGKSLPPMPDDLGSPTIRADFLRWTALSLQRDWKPDSRCWCNLHLCLYMYCPSWKYCIAHPRAFAACVLSSDVALEDPWCCWACYVPTSGKEGAHLKTVWHTLDDFLYHWYNKHSKDIHYRWTTIALELGISREELASACLSVNLDSCPLPSSDVGLQTVPKSLPDRPWYGHNALVRGPPWNVTIRGDFARVFHTPKPPIGPPPAHVLNQDSSKQSSSGHRPLPSLNASGPIRPLAKPAPSATSAASSASNPAPVIELEEELRPAVVHANGSRFAAVAPSSNKSTMGWVIPLTVNSWNVLANKEMLAFATPYPTIRAYSDARPVWFNRWTLPPTLRAWLLSMEEHTFYLFIYMLLGSMTIRSPTSFSVADREAISARLHVYKQDLVDEISHFKAFSKVNDQAWMVSEGVLAHVRSVIGLRFPLNPGYTFVRAPEWITVPRSIQESKVYFKMA